MATIGSIHNSFSLGQLGMQRGLAGMGRAAAEVAGQGAVGRVASVAPSGDFSHSLVDLQAAAQQTRAAAKVVATGDALLGRLLDERA